MRYSGPNREIWYLFVDGGYMRKVIERSGKEIYNDENILIDFRQLGGAYTKVFYYECMPCRKKDEPHDLYKERVVKMDAFLNL